MKLNKIFMAFAATAIVGCSSEDFNEFSATQAVDDSRLVELNQNFVLAGVGEDGAGTRTHWDAGTGGALTNVFLPIYNADAAADALLSVGAKLEEQAVGLCWLGQVPGEKVYTNYQFYHFGWLNIDETKADVQCNKLENGAFYSDLKLTAAGTANAEAVQTNFVYTPASGKTGTPSADLNFNSGVYKTDNKAIFGGKYIVYYPFNKDFKDAGTIPAAAETKWANVPTDWKSPEIGKATFRYSAPVTIEGGDQAAGFGLKNLSSIAQLRVATVTGDACIGQKIDQIVLFSESQKLLKKAYLAADKIVAGKTGVDLYADTEGTKTIVANFGTAVALDKADGAVTSAYITVLPTTVEDLVVLVHSNTLQKWAKVSLPNTVFEAGAAKRLDITVKNADFTTDFIAVDEGSLTKALTEANAVATATNPQTITVIGDITFDGPVSPATAKTYDINATLYSNIANITIKGDAIIVPQDVTLNLQTNLESDLRVLGKSCCTGTTGGRVDVLAGGKLNNVTMEPTEAKVTAATYDTYNPQVTYSAAATVAAGKKVDVQAGNVVVKAAVAHKGDIEIAEGAKLTVNAAGDLNFMGSSVTNDGTIEVKKGGKFDMTDKNGNATATDGKRMTNNGKFIHNVDAGVGTAVQSMKQNGEYRCKVNKQTKLDDAFLQWTACSVIEMVNDDPQNYDLGTAASIATPYKHNDKYIDIEVNATAATTFSNPTPDNKEINIGKLTVKSPFAIDYTNTVGTTTGKRTLTVNGDMAVTANTSIKDSKKINIKQNLTLTGAWIDFAGGKVNEDGLAVTGDITVSGAAGNFSASDVDALNITCANFYLKSGAKAEFGNRTDGAAKNLVVRGTISNPDGCTFDIHAANTDAPGALLAWVTCKELVVGGNFTGARPIVVAE